MSVDVEKRTGVAIGGLGITYQATLIDGRTVAFETAIDLTATQADIDDVLDVIAAATKRQQAIEELPAVRDALSFTLAQLASMKKQRAALVAGHQAKHSAMNANRRNPKPLEAGSTDANLAQIDQTIAATEQKIRVAKARIPYLEAIRDRREPPDPFPQYSEDAAEAA